MIISSLNFLSFKLFRDAFINGERRYNAQNIIINQFTGRIFKNKSFAVSWDELILTLIR